MLRRVLLGALLIGLAVAPPAHAQGFNTVAYATVTADVTLTTTAETVIVTSTDLSSIRDDTEVIVIAWAQLTTGTNTTAVTPRIRRGSTTGGTLIGEANAVTLGAAAGSTEQFYAIAVERIAGATRTPYSLTLQQTAASANGSALQGGIVVLGR